MEKREAIELSLLLRVFERCLDKPQALPGRRDGRLAGTARDEPLALPDSEEGWKANTAWKEPQYRFK